MITVRALLAVLLLLNGLAMPPATAMHPATGMASHAGHAPDSATPDPEPHASHAQHAGDLAASDCCEASSCDCGCAAPHALILPVSLPRSSWRTALREFTLMVSSFHSSPLPAPFRPPA